MKKLMLSLMLAVICVLAFAVSGCNTACTSEDQDLCRNQHNDCTWDCDPLSGGYDDCVDTCDDELDSCLEDAGC